MKKWKFLRVAGYKSLFVSPDVIDQVMSDLKQKGSEIFECVDSDNAFVDLPGMCLVDRKLWKGEIDGLTIEIPATDVGSILVSMKKNVDLKKFVDRGWWNVYGWIHCLSLSKDQYLSLIAALERDYEWAEAAADADVARLQAGIKQVNEELAAQGKGVSIVSAKSSQLNKPINGDWN